MQQLLSAIRSPMAAVKNASKENPFVSIIAIVLIAQPIVSAGTNLVQELMAVHTALDVDDRPVTERELNIVNSKIDFLQNLVVQDMQGDREIINGAKAHENSGSVASPSNEQSYEQLKQKLDQVQQKLNATYEKKHDKKTL